MESTGTKKILTEGEALEKLRHFCAYQERSPKQVAARMNRLEIPSEGQDKLRKILEEEGFLDAQRFSKAFARGKSRIKGWGPLKIKQHLQSELGESFHAPAMAEAIDMEAAQKKLNRDLDKKYQLLKAKNDPQLKPKLLRFVLSRGFSTEDAWRFLGQLD